MAERPGPEETRAEIARRRLAELAAAFDAQWSPADEDEPEPVVVRRRLRDRHVALIGIAAVAVLVVLGWWLLAGRARPLDQPVPLPSASSAAPATTEAPAELVVDVVGAVARPGIVTLPAGSRVYEAIEAAGGVVGAPDMTTVNLAREVSDGEQILVGITSALPPPGAGGGAELDLNTADQAALEELPGIGPVTAQAILDWRSENGPFRSVDDLLDVKGIGEATLGELRDHVVVR